MISLADSILSFSQTDWLISGTVGLYGRIIPGSNGVIYFQRPQSGSKLKKSKWKQELH